MLENAAKIQKQFELQPQRLHFLHTLIGMLYTCIWKLKGHQSVPLNKLAGLRRLLLDEDEYTLENMQTFFAEGQ